MFVLEGLKNQGYLLLSLSLVFINGISNVLVEISVVLI
ncbi:hypothetical protein MNB_SUP05-SYMBIONT-5-347 [hydrothermal vent metagenome]|uniref:Uncharacterized protein n=1 Tax=hydrothermal vent metagenome TaxID=652676 RepID=A0A1W1E0U7_9ZZZZ